MPYYCRYDGRFELVYRHQWLPSEIQSIQDMSDLLRETAEYIDAMAADGVTLVEDKKVGDDHAFLTTNDPEVAMEYGFGPSIRACEEENLDECRCGWGRDHNVRREV